MVSERGSLAGTCLPAVVAVAISAIGGRVLFVALTAQKFESRDQSWSAFVLRWLLPCVVLYSIWMVLYQNVLYKSRHVLPLPHCRSLLVLSIGAVEVLRKRIGRGIVASGALAYALVAVVLAAQHKEPTAIAQVVEQVRVISETEPDLRVVAVPLVTFMLEVQGVDATFVEADDRKRWLCSTRIEKRVPRLSLSECVWKMRSRRRSRPFITIPLLIACGRRSLSMYTDQATNAHPTSTPTTILGGGLAGLAFAYFANLAGERVKLFEAAPFLGGNGRTLRFGEALSRYGGSSAPRSQYCCHRGIQ